MTPVLYFTLPLLHEHPSNHQPTLQTFLAFSPFCSLITGFHLPFIILPFTFPFFHLFPSFQSKTTSILDPVFWHAASFPPHVSHECHPFPRYHPLPAHSFRPLGNPRIRMLPSWKFSLWFNRGRVRELRTTPVSRKSSTPCMYFLI